MKKKLHFIGIGGIGMSSLAKLMLMQKHQVSGSDTQKSEILQKLEQMGAIIYLDQKKENLPHDSTVIVSSSIPEDNPELEMAKKLKSPILHRSDLLNLLTEEKFAIAVAGTHGKTTTASLLVHVLEEAFLDPSFSVGGMTKEKQNAHYSNSPYFVFEACESDGTLVKYHPQGAIITNADNDHMDHFKTWENLLSTYAAFAQQVKKKDLLMVYGDTPFPHQGIRFGFSAGNDLVASNLRLVERHYLFDIAFKGVTYRNVQINSPLKHNVLNALAVFGLCINLQIKEEVIRKAFTSFASPKKRLDIRYEENEVLLIDDYGHHPNEIASTLQSVREAWPLHRILCLFQPHRYTRIHSCLYQFKHVFDACDHLLITDLYSAGEKPIQGINTSCLQEVIAKESQYVARHKLAHEVHSYLRPFDLVISFGAGDISSIHDEILQIGPIRPLKVGLVYGGKSAEHEISCNSSKHVLKGLDQPLFETEPLYIDTQGNWHHKHTQITLGEAIESLKRCDAVFPVLHGRFGEDGTIQGMFEMLDIPYVGGPSIFHQISMDKSFTKLLARTHQIEVAPFVIHKKGDPLNLQGLQFPLFVKPVHLGSSIGITRVENAEMLKKAIDYAFEFDNKLIIEEQVIGREIEYAVLQTVDGPIAFHPGEILTHGQIYSYEAKYGAKAFGCDIQAQIPQGVADHGKALATKIFSLLDGRGYARIDFFMEPSGRLLLNEVNPIPGFTHISLFPKVAERYGYPIEKLTSHLIALSLHYNRMDKTRLCTIF